LCSYSIQRVFPWILTIPWNVNLYPDHAGMGKKEVHLIHSYTSQRLSMSLPVCILGNRPNRVLLLLLGLYMLIG
jgi:hypothetical protein